MKRFPLFCTVLLFIVMCASLSFWGLRMFKPAARDVVLPEADAGSGLVLGGWGSVFGASKAAPSGGNFVLKGIILARNPRESVAIVSVNEKPNVAVRVGREISEGVTVKEVSADYVIISDNGAEQRVDLPKNAPRNLITPNFEQGVAPRTGFQSKSVLQEVAPIVNAASLPAAN